MERAGICNIPESVWEGAAVEAREIVAKRCELLSELGAQAEEGGALQPWATRLIEENRNALQLLKNPEIYQEVIDGCDRALARAVLVSDASMREMGRSLLAGDRGRIMAALNDEHFASRLVANIAETMLGSISAQTASQPTEEVSAERIEVCAKGLIERGAFGFFPSCSKVGEETLIATAEGRGARLITVDHARDDHSPSGFALTARMLEYRGGAEGWHVTAMVNSEEMPDSVEWLDDQLPFLVDFDMRADELTVVPLEPDLARGILAGDALAMSAALDCLLQGALEDPSECLPWGIEESDVDGAMSWACEASRIDAPDGKDAVTLESAR